MFTLAAQLIPWRLSSDYCLTYPEVIHSLFVLDLSDSVDNPIKGAVSRTHRVTFSPHNTNMHFRVTCVFTFV
jgi:hypothetical protein